MDNIKTFCKDALKRDIFNLPAISGDLKAALRRGGVYTLSLERAEGAVFFLARENGRKALVIFGEKKTSERFAGGLLPFEGRFLKITDLSHKNAVELRTVFPWTSPTSISEHSVTMGLGDRLGLATPAHIRAVADFHLRPVFAQQSFRELMFTGRSYSDVVDSASWGVFQENYKRGFGADGDHVKTEDELANALSGGATMITIDVSEYIDANSGVGERAVSRVVDIYNKFLRGKGIDYEISIDETSMPTRPAAHRFVAEKLSDAGISPVSIAPRFCGEFQKGIDYIGNTEEFTSDLREHSEVARRFGHKISIHSGSDKFSIFPVVSECTGGRFHLKTAGTNWLEAVRLISMKDPGLFREMINISVERFGHSSKFYHIGASEECLKDVDKLSDAQLPHLLSDNEPRQVIHISYGAILNALRKEIYQLLDKFEEEHYAIVSGHIKKHINLLGVPVKS